MFDNGRIYLLETSSYLLWKLKLMWILSPYLPKLAASIILNNRQTFFYQQILLNRLSSVMFIIGL